MDRPAILWQSSFNATLVRVFNNKLDLGRFAAAQAAAILSGAIAASGLARLIVATGNSQLEMIEALAHEPGIDWSSVDVFHMDEYVGISPHHPSSFRYWIRTRVTDKVHPRHVHYLDGNAPDLDAECLRYAGLLAAGPINLAFVGFGENGHIAFNDPPVADFHDPSMVKPVMLDEACRLQQCGEGHFADLDAVPTQALTITCPGLFRAQRWVCCVPDSRKADAVRNALEGPVSTACPASLVRTHPGASVYLDVQSAVLLKDFRAPGFRASEPEP